MAGTRVEKIGTVFTRVTGLLKSGVMQEADAPVWYEVFKAFPPKTEQKYYRPVDPRPPIDIVYNEDTIRANFFTKYVRFESTNLTDPRPSLAYRFVEHYKEIKASGVENEQEIFDKAIRKLTDEGVVLKTNEADKREKEERQSRVQDEWAGRATEPDILEQLFEKDQSQMHVDRATTVNWSLPDTASERTPQAEHTEGDLAYADSGWSSHDRENSDLSDMSMAETQRSSEGERSSEGHMQEMMEALDELIVDKDDDDDKKG